MKIKDADVQISLKKKKIEKLKNKYSLLKKGNKTVDLEKKIRIVEDEIEELRKAKKGIEKGHSKDNNNTNIG